MLLRHAHADDLPAIVAIYNASIPGRLATADTEPVTVASRAQWFADFNPQRRPLWVATEIPDRSARTGEIVLGWLGLRSFYGRPAYGATVEVAVYVDPNHQGSGIGRTLLEHAVAAAPQLGIRTLLGFVFAHNSPSLRLFERAGFASWGHLPRIAELDGSERDLAILGRRVA